jgi:hypothetical protein
VRQAKQLLDTADAPSTPTTAVSWQPAVMTPVLLKASPHVHDDVCRLDSRHRNMALLDVPQKLASSDALVLGRRNGIATSLQVSTKIVQHLSLRKSG